MKNYLIYRIISPSGKIYIGVTNNYKRRMAEHKSDWLNRPEKIALHNSFSKYGYNNHHKEVIFDCLTKEEAYLLEKELIEKHNLTNSKKGLNSRHGGQGGNMIDWKSEKGLLLKEKANKKRLENYYKEWECRYDVIIKMKDNYTIEQIAKFIGVSTSALGRYMQIKKISVPRKSKFNLKKIALEIAPLYKIGYTNQRIIDEKGYSKGTICRAKKLIIEKQKENGI